MGRGKVKGTKGIFGWGSTKTNNGSDPNGRRSLVAPENTKSPRWGERGRRGSDFVREGRSGRKIDRVRKRGDRLEGPERGVEISPACPHPTQVR